MHDVVVQGGMRRESGGAEHADHAAILGEGLGDEAGDAVAAGDGSQVLEEEGGDAAALVGVVHDERDLGVAGVGIAVVADDGDDVVADRGH